MLTFEALPERLAALHRVHAESGRSSFLGLRFGGFKT